MDFIEPVANIEKSGKAIKNKIKMKRFYIKFEFLLKKKKEKKKNDRVLKWNTDTDRN